MMSMERAPEPEGVLALHASAVAVNGTALLFLGPSGAGKSTIWRLLQGVARPVADDRVYLHARGREWHVTDAGKRLLRGPLHETEVKALQGLPLQAIFRLHQACQTYVNPIDSLQLCRHLVEAFFEIPWQQEYGLEIKRAVFSDLASVAHKVKGYRLHFERSQQIVQTLLECLITQKVHFA